MKEGNGKMRKKRLLGAESRGDLKLKSSNDISRPTSCMLLCERRFARSLAHYESFHPESRRGRSSNKDAKHEEHRLNLTTHPSAMHLSGRLEEWLSSWFLPQLNISSLR